MGKAHTPSTRPRAQITRWPSSKFLSESEGCLSRRDRDKPTDIRSSEPPRVSEYVSADAISAKVEGTR